MRHTKIVILQLLLWGLFAACGSREAKDSVDALPEIFPDYVGVTIPRNIAPLNFCVRGATHIEASLIGCRGHRVQVHGTDHVEFPIGKWHSLLEGEDSLRVSVSVWSDDKPEGIRYKDFAIHIADSIDPWIAYRLIPPGYEGWNRMGIYQRDLASFDVEPIVENSQNNNGCVNCHSFANYDPRNFTFHARGKNGGTIVIRNGQMSKVDIKSMGNGRHGSYNIWHPSTRYIAFSSNATHQSFYGQSQDKIEVYDLWSDLIVYDIDKGRVLTDERFTDTLSLEIFPTFSPDGKWLYFSTAHPVRMPMEVDKLHYSIVRVPFNESDGSLGEIDTVYSAHDRGGTALMPRISPDGRYMLFSLAECGAFNLYHNESDLQMMDLSTGQMVDTEVINSPRMESYHAWSSNGKWILYSTKKFDGRYTRLMMAYWDGTRFHKPFLLPQQNPEDNTTLLMAYNIPEFIKRPVILSRDGLARLFQDGQ